MKSPLNYDQFSGILRAVVPAIVALLSVKWFSLDVATIIGTAITSVAMAIWSVLNNKTGKVVGR